MNYVKRIAAILLIAAITACMAVRANLDAAIAAHGGH